MPRSRSSSAKRGKGKTVTQEPRDADELSAPPQLDQPVISPDQLPGTVAPLFTDKAAAKDKAGKEGDEIFETELPTLPASLASRVHEWKRVTQLSDPALKVPTICASREVTSRETPVSNRLVVPSCSSWARDLGAAFNVIASNGQTLLDEGEFLWEAIFPKGKKETAFNPAGKYSVRLWHRGHWRRVVVDDRIPVDADGAPLFPHHPSGSELWPLLLSKAALVASLDRTDVDGAAGFVHLLTGWLPKPLSNTEQLDTIVQQEHVAAVIAHQAPPAGQEHDGAVTRAKLDDLAPRRTAFDEQRARQQAQLDQLKAQRDAERAEFEAAEDQDTSKKAKKKPSSSKERSKKGDDSSADEDSEFVLPPKPLNETELFDVHLITLPPSDVAAPGLIATHPITGDVTLLSVSDLDVVWALLAPSKFANREFVEDIAAHNPSHILAVQTDEPNTIVTLFVESVRGADGQTSPFQCTVSSLDWETHVKVPCVQHRDGVRGFGLIELPIASSGAHLFRVAVESAFGHCVTALSHVGQLCLDLGCGAEGTAMALSHGLRTKVASGEYQAQHPDQWCVLFKQSLLIKQESLVSFWVSLAHRDLVPFVTLELVNNDDLAVTTFALLETKPVRLAPNTNGYTVLCHALVPSSAGVHVIASSWRMRCVANGEFDAKKGALAIQPESASTVQQFSGHYHRNQHAFAFEEILSSDAQNNLSIQVSLLTDSPSGWGRSSGVDIALSGAAAKDGSRPALFSCNDHRRQHFYLPSVVLAKKSNVLLTLKLGEHHSPDLVNDLRWRIRVVSGGAVAAADDCSRLAQLDNQKQEWWSSDKNRADKAKAARQRFLVSRRGGSSGTCVVVTQEFRDGRAAQRRKELETQVPQLTDVMTQRRKQEHQVLKQDLQLESDTVAECVAQSGEARSSEWALRDEYRDAVVGWDEQLRILSDAVSTASSSSASSSRPNSSSKKKRAQGKKKQDADLEHDLTEAIVHAALVVESEEAMPLWRLGQSLVVAQTQICNCLIKSLRKALKLDRNSARPDSDQEQEGSQDQSEEDEDPISPEALIWALQRAQFAERFVRVWPSCLQQLFEQAKSALIDHHFEPLRQAVAEEMRDREELQTLLDNINATSLAPTLAISFDQEAKPEPESQDSPESELQLEPTSGLCVSVWVGGSAESLALLDSVKSFLATPVTEEEREAFSAYQKTRKKKKSKK